MNNKHLKYPCARHLKDTGCHPSQRNTGELRCCLPGTLYHPSRETVNPTVPSSPVVSLPLTACDVSSCSSTLSVLRLLFSLLDTLLHVEDLGSVCILTCTSLMSSDVEHVHTCWLGLTHLLLWGASSNSPAFRWDACLVIEQKASLCSLEEQPGIRLELSLDWPLASSLGFSWGLCNTGLVDDVIRWVISLVSNPTL